MSKPSQNVTDKLAFHGKKSLFAGWKDKVKAHPIARGDALVVTELQAGRKEPVARYEHALLREISVPEPGENTSDDETSAFALPVYEIWRAIERRYGLNTASGVVELVQRIKKIANLDFKSVAHLFQQLKAAGDQANRNGCEALKNGLISQHLMLIKVLAVLPGHLWGSAIVFTLEGFTVDKVETKLSAIFGAESRDAILDLTKGVRVAHVDAAPAKPGVTGTGKLSSSVRGKKKVPPVPEHVSHYNLGAMSCHYCAREKPRRSENRYPIEACLPKTVPCKAVQTTQPPSPRVESEQPASPTVSVTPPPGTFEPIDTDEPMEQFDVPVNAGSVIMSQPLGTEAIAETARGIDSMAMMLEDTARSLYPYLLNLHDDALTSDPWVLASGCGFGLISDASKLVEHRPDNGYMFTLAERSKPINLHVGTKSGYQIIESQSGVFKIVLYEGNLVFVAKAVNGAYYVQNNTIKERQILCNAAKAQPCVPLENNGGERLEKTLQERRVKLDHLNKDMVISMLSKQLVTGMPTLPASGLRKVPFFCTTCAEMSYRNKKGSRDTQPISTIHMDTNGPMKTMGVCGSIGTIKYFLSIIDDNTSWRWTYGLRNKQEVYEMTVRIQDRESMPRREIKKPKRYSDYQCFQAKLDKSIAKDILENRVPRPRSLEEALRDPHREQWKQALELEYDSLIENGTWRLVPLPPSRKALPCHWVLVVKYNAEGSVERFKARLVAQGDHQQYGVGCDEVYTPVARFESLRLVLAIGTILDCHIHQMDVHTAFLNGTMEGEQKINMRQQHEFVERGHENQVCELLKSIYGLKQAPRIWLKAELSKRFKMKDLEDIHYILKLEVHRLRDQRVMMISQRKYIAELITKYNLGDSAPVLTPQGPGHVLASACLPKERKSVTGDVIQMAGTSISWCSSKQGSVSLSNAEAGLIALSEGAKESEWLWYLLVEMGFPRSKPVQVWCDSNAAISIVKNPGNFKATKPIEIRYLFTRDLVELVRLKIAYCSTTETTADILTKALPTKQFLKLREKPGVRDLELSPVLSRSVEQGAQERTTAGS
ncbi:unnamed protein product [Phytophthora fragariaefolia]|uniref:Unnamed protein product n=1 Tax=Phytophthora fragariaefolia TaxID=1490495 RepID=A0A9W6WTB2_9STRA|nr:unnamed protein product [Phytophthora fragariaefolia]